MVVPPVPPAAPRPCSVCHVTAAALVSSGGVTGPACPVHGYIVLAAMGGAVVTILDGPMWGRLSWALRHDGHPITFAS